MRRWFNPPSLPSSGGKRQSRSIELSLGVYLHFIPDLLALTARLAVPVQYSQPSSTFLYFHTSTVSRLRPSLDTVMSDDERSSSPTAEQYGAPQPVVDDGESDDDLPAAGRKRVSRKCANEYS